MGVINKVVIDEKTHSIAASAFAVCETPAGTKAKVATLEDGESFELVEGTTIQVYFKYTNNATNPTLNINETGELPIYLHGTTRASSSVSSSWMAGGIVSLTYNTAVVSTGGWYITDFQAGSGGGGGTGDYAPVDHASQDPTYGVGNTGKFGHVKLSNAHASESGITEGFAATPFAVKHVHDEVAALSTVYAPLNHASASESYGIGAASRYGHVQLYSSWNSDAANYGNESGHAATPRLVWNVYTTLDSAKAPTNHASGEDIYGVGNTGKFGHVKLTNAFASTSSIPEGFAVTPAAVKSVHDEVTALSTVYAPLNHASGNSTYGIGNTGQYGHVKLTGIFGAAASTLDAASGYAATPSALHNVYTKIPTVTAVLSTGINIADVNSDGTITHLYAPAGGSGGIQQVPCNWLADTGVNSIINKPSIPSTAEDVNAVPITRTINGKSLSSNITLDISDLDWNYVVVQNQSFNVNEALDALSEGKQLKVALDGYDGLEDAVGIITNTNYIEFRTSPWAHNDSQSWVTYAGDGSATGWSTQNFQPTEVSIDRKVTTGTNIADITINNVTTALYAPSGGSGGGNQVNSDWTASAGVSSILNKPDSFNPTQHASDNSDYGIGTNGLYGHVKLSDSLDSQSSAADGVAATPQAIYQLRQEIPDVSAQAGYGSQGVFIGKVIVDGEATNFYGPAGDFILVNNNQLISYNELQNIGAAFINGTEIKVKNWMEVLISDEEEIDYLSLNRIIEEDSDGVPVKLEFVGVSSNQIHTWVYDHTVAGNVPLLKWSGSYTSIPNLDTNTATVSTDDYLVVNRISSGIHALNINEVKTANIKFGTSTNSFLANDGTWRTPSGSGGGSTVSVTAINTQGLNIADITVDNVTTHLYAPADGSGGGLIEHSHGNLTNGGDITTSATISNGDRLVINDESASKITNSSITFGTSTTSFLANDGTWRTPSTSSGESGVRQNWVGSCSAPSSSTKAVSCTDFVLTEGAIIAIKCTNGITSPGTKININNTGAINVWSGLIRGLPTCSVGTTITVMYDGTSYFVIATYPAIDESSGGGSGDLPSI